MARTGRPKAVDPKSYQIAVRMTPAELDALDAYCEANDVGRAAAIREAIRRLTAETKSDTK